MDVKKAAKHLCCSSSFLIGLDRFWRFRFRKRLLVVMYHGVASRSYSLPVWTQLPLNIFQRQIRWLARHYIPVSLAHVVSALSGHSTLPDRAVLVTFDDGLKNNAVTAYPVLKRHGVPAAIFLTVDFVDTDTFFWVDELLLLIMEAAKCSVELPLRSVAAQRHFARKQYWKAYHAEVEFLKRVPEDERISQINSLSKHVQYDRKYYQEDFGMLSWQDVHALDEEGLVDFGVHTATHQILTSLAPDKIADELFGAKERLERQLGREVDAFCYPNGKMYVDYLPEHRDLLRKGGYKCAFSTDLGLCDLDRVNAFSIPRVSSANDALVDSHFFQLNASGLCEYRRKFHNLLP